MVPRILGVYGWQCGSNSLELVLLCGGPLSPEGAFSKCLHCGADSGPSNLGHLGEAFFKCVWSLSFY